MLFLFRKCLTPLIVLALLVLASKVQAQTPTPTEIPYSSSLTQEQIREKARRLFEDAEAKPTEVQPTTASPSAVTGSTSDSANSAYQEALTASYKRDAWSYDYKTRIYEWQFSTTKIVFFVVIAMVAAGFCFAGMHFQKSIKPVKPVRRTQDKGTDSDTHEPESLAESVIASEKHELEASATGFKISTSAIGVVILLISFMFFYLYLQVIYPIK